MDKEVRSLFKIAIALFTKEFGYLTDTFLKTRQKIGVTFDSHQISTVD